MWIEICGCCVAYHVPPVTSLAEVWIEIDHNMIVVGVYAVTSLAEVWIEIWLHIQMP